MNQDFGFPFFSLSADKGATARIASFRRSSVLAAPICRAVSMKRSTCGFSFGSDGDFRGMETSGMKSSVRSAAVRLANIVRIAAKVANSPEFGGEWCESISAASSFFDDASAKAREVCVLPVRVQERGELVRVDWNQSGCPAGLSEFSNLLCLEIGPFIEGVGNVVTENGPKGEVIVRRDLGKVLDVHSGRSALKNPMASDSDFSQ
jgi:hypothetical protein